MLTTSTSIFQILHSPNNSFSGFNFTPFFHSLSFLLSRTNHVGEYFAHFHHTRLAFFFGEQKEVQIQPKFSRMLYINTAKFSFLVNIHDIYLMLAPFFLVKTNGMALWANISTCKWSKQLARATFTSRAGANWLKVTRT